MDKADIILKREELFTAWQRVMKICNALLDKAEEDPLAVRASMLQQLVRILTSSGKIIQDMEKHLEKVEAEPEVDPETGKFKELSPEKLAEIEALEKEYERMDEYEDDFGEDSLDDAEPESSIMDTKSGFNFKRS